LVRVPEPAEEQLRDPVGAHKDLRGDLIPRTDRAEPALRLAGRRDGRTHTLPVLLEPPVRGLAAVEPDHLAQAV